MNNNLPELNVYRKDYVDGLLDRIVKMESEIVDARIWSKTWKRAAKENKRAYDIMVATLHEEWIRYNSEKHEQ